MTDFDAEVLASLPERERRIIELRYGLPDGKLHTYEEIAKELGLTPERVRQIEKKALTELSRS